MAIAQSLPSNGIRVTTNALTEPYWQGTKEGRLLAACCAECGKYRMPFAPFCSNCLAERVSWEELAGPGRVYSFTVVRASAAPGRDCFTYVPAIVEFDQAPGIRYAGNIIDVEIAKIKVDMPVQVAWAYTAEGWGLPLFYPADSAFRVNT